MPTGASARGRTAALALALGVWTVLVAIVAMHGLPMQQPQSPHAGAVGMSMSMTAASTASHASEAMGGTATQVDGVPGAAAQAYGTASGCDAADHCTATLRTVDQAAAPTVAVVAPRPVLTSVGSSREIFAIPVARPPDLDTLQISRT